MARYALARLGLSPGKLAGQTVSIDGRTKDHYRSARRDHPKAKTANPEDFIDARFIEEFDKSGYIDSLYGRKK